jgi:hypothetical protein
MDFQVGLRDYNTVVFQVPASSRDFCTTLSKHCFVHPHVIDLQSQWIGDNVPFEHVELGSLLELWLASGYVDAKTRTVNS